MTCLADIYSGGVEAAEAILRDVYRVETTKALDPLDANDFITIVMRLSRALRRVSRPAEEAALRRALERLDVDWPNLSKAAQGQVVRAAREALRAVELQVLPRVDQLFEAEAEPIVGQARRSAVQRFGLRIAAELNATDLRTAKFVRESQANFVRDEYGRRRQSFSQKARSIVTSGLERGLGRDDIVAELTSVMPTEAFNRNETYWEVVAMVFTNRARSATQLVAFEDAGLESYRFEAVLDEATSEVCRFMHGKVFSVAAARSRIQEVERSRDPELIRDLQPFVQVGVGDDGSEVLFYEKGGRRRPVARVDESAVGHKDRVGEYSRGLSPERLEAAGLSVPPLHGRCRSTLIAET